MKTFQIGPDLPGDVRTSRPYFLIPLLVPGEAPHADAGRVAATIRQEQVTDVYVFSHGWHRNFFSAVAAYDRLVSRFAVLTLRGRLTPPPQPYRPLFLAMHWNSDPDEDGWVDGGGRRDKLSFLARAVALFEPAPGAGEGDFQNLFEDLYEFMTYISAPDVPALDSGLDAKSQALSARLQAQCEIRGRVGTGAATTLPDKVALAWRCYDEADTQRVLLDQRQTPQRFANPLIAVANLLKILVAVVALTATLGLLPKLLAWLHLRAPTELALRVAGHALLRVPVLHALWYGVEALPWTLRFFAWVGLLALAALAILLGTGLWHQTVWRGKAGRGLPVLAVGSWLPLQALFTLPLVLYLFTTFLFRTWAALLVPLAWVLGRRLPVGPWGAAACFLLGCACYGLLTRRLRRTRNSQSDRLTPGKKDGRGTVPPRLRDGLAWVARRPIRWFRRATARDSRSVSLADALDKQLAFWEMQRRAVLAGDGAGRFLDDLWGRLAQDGGTAPRLHLIGHSFGGVVVANAARHLAQTRTAIDSLVLLQAALGTDWFETEAWCRDVRKLHGALGCVFSAYDLANGSFYPAANDGRMAAGYVGLYRAGPDDVPQTLGRDGLFASLVQPPDLRPRLQGDPPFALNMDASRLIFNGSVAAGGGHDDIFKDDVVHMLWAVTRLAP